MPFTLVDSDIILSLVNFVHSLGSLCRDSLRLWLSHDLRSFVVFVVFVVFGVGILEVLMTSLCPLSEYPCLICLIALSIPDPNKRR